MTAIPVDQGAEPNDFKTWEYTTFDLTKPKTDIDGLNRLGREGWGGGFDGFVVGCGMAVCASHRSVEAAAGQRRSVTRLSVSKRARHTLAVMPAVSLVASILGCGR